MDKVELKPKVQRISDCCDTDKKRDEDKIKDNETGRIFSDFPTFSNTPSLNLSIANVVLWFLTVEPSAATIKKDMKYMYGEATPFEFVKYSPEVFPESVLKKNFVGQYYCEELGMGYRLSLGKEGLVATNIKAAPIHFSPVMGTIFAGDQWYMGSIEFQEHGAGNITGFHVLNDAIRNLWFKKIKDWPTTWKKLPLIFCGGPYRNRCMGIIVKVDSILEINIFHHENRNDLNAFKRDYLGLNPDAFFFDSTEGYKDLEFLKTGDSLSLEIDDGGNTYTFHPIH